MVDLCWRQWPTFETIFHIRQIQGFCQVLGQMLQTSRLANHQEWKSSSTHQIQIQFCIFLSIFHVIVNKRERGSWIWKEEKFWSGQKTLKTLFSMQQGRMYRWNCYAASNVKMWRLELFVFERENETCQMLEVSLCQRPCHQRLQENLALQRM